MFWIASRNQALGRALPNLAHLRNNSLTIALTPGEFLRMAVGPALRCLAD
jgi:hypothetical protein